MRKFLRKKRDDEVRPAAIIKVIGQEPKDTALEKTKPKAPPPLVKKLPRGVLWGVAGLAAFFVVGSVISFYVAKGQARRALTRDVNTLQAGVADLQNLDPQSAAQKFASLKNASPSDFGALFEIFGSLFQGSAQAVHSFGDLANQLALFSGELADLSSGSFQFAASGNGTAFLADLTRLRATIIALNDASGKLSSFAASAGNGSADAYLPLIAQLQGAETFLNTFIPWLAAPAPHHVLVLFENPSEIRPAGGFLGSYADITIASGSITSIDIHDIADVDAAFTPKIIPPKPLQQELTRWRPADANWFFDFPTSASETAAFFERSNLYAKASTTFDAVIAVSPKVVSDLLAVTGPLTIPAAHGVPATTFTADNFLVQTQAIVQAGQASSATYPKQVLRDLAAALFAKLSALNAASSSAAAVGPAVAAGIVPQDSSSQTLLADALDWIDKKDVMVYFKDPTMENFAASYGAAGEVYELPQKFNGDYFALVDANVAGGKQDTFISSTVNYVGQIGADGTFTGHVRVTRTHHGNTSPSWWYRTPDTDYLQLFVTDGSSVQNVAGGFLKTVMPKINYGKMGYAADPLVAAIEGTEQTLYAYPGVAWHEESGKTVFATWSTLKAGATAQFALDYAHRLFAPPANGVPYQFVFEKQAGTTRHYDIEIDAPLGYVFAENNIASFTYHTDNLPGRIIFNLTLKKL